MSSTPPASTPRGPVAAVPTTGPNANLPPGSAAGGTLASRQKIAVAIAVVTGATVWLLKAWATSRLLTNSGKEANDLQISNQVSSLAGIILGILIAPAIKDTKWTFVLAGVGLILGSAGPWVWQILTVDHSFIYQLAVVGKDNFAPGMFSFGVSFLVKSSEADK
jgi:hypothetical protein